MNEVINIWESYVNNHWQLFMSDTWYDAGAIEDNPHYPETIYLKQNYPNPFNATTAISYQLSAFSHVNLTVYNGLGQKVRILVNQIQQAGSYRVLWDGRNDTGEDLPTSLYFYRIQGAGSSDVKKCILLK